MTMETRLYNGKKTVSLTYGSGKNWTVACKIMKYVINPQQTLSTMVKNESISPKVRKKTRVPTFTTTIEQTFGSFGHSNQSRKRNKRNPNWKRSRTLTVCR